jgi:hypothetical protein
MIGGLLGSICAGTLKASFLLWLSGLNMPLWFYCLLPPCYWFPFYFRTWLRYQKLDGMGESEKELRIVTEYTAFRLQCTAFCATVVIFGPGRTIAYWIIVVSIAVLGVMRLFYMTLRATARVNNSFLDFSRTIYNALAIGIHKTHSFLFFLVFDIDSYSDMVRMYILPWTLRKTGEFTEVLLHTLMRRSHIPQYKYEKFETQDFEKSTRTQIRLLRIPRQLFFFGHLKCSLEIVDLESSPAYEALSYRWGFGMDNKKKTSATSEENPGQIEKRLIHVNGRSMWIPRSSYELLHARSSIWHTRLVWIDAICIDQGNNDEKSFQVPLMGSIYSKASRIIVWPGDRLDSGLASAMILRLLSAYEMFDAPQYEMKDYFADEIDKPGWKALVKLLHDPYFTRVWVVKEIAVGENVQIYHGGHYTQWDIFAIAYAECIHPQRRVLMSGNNDNGLDSPVMRDHNDAIGGIYVMISLKKVYSEEQEGKTHIGHLLADCASMHATDPRDKVWGLNGLLGDSPLPREIIDYKKTQREVFIETACYSLRQRFDPYAILAYAGLGWRQRSSTLPTWVPNWAEERLALSLWDRHHSGSGQSTATHLEPEIEILFSDKTPILATKGLILDRICGETSSVTLLTEEFKGQTLRERGIGIARWYKEATALAETGDTYPYSSQSRQEAFWRTIVVDRNFIERPAPASFEQCNKIYEKLSDARLKTVGLPTEAHLASLQADPELSAIWPQGLEELSRFHEFQAAIANAADGRKFCVTDEGYMCLIPTGSRVGDLICVIFGAPTPFVLREYKDKIGHYATDKSLYQLVGECYVHGFMDRFDGCNAERGGFVSPASQVLNIV